MFLFTKYLFGVFLPPFAQNKERRILEQAILHLEVNSLMQFLRDLFTTLSLEDLRGRAFLLAADGSSFPDHFKE